MAERMLQFIHLPQQTPEKRAASVRREDFAEIYDDFDPIQAAAQASRCSQCGVPFCSVHCPLCNNIPDWLKLTAEGRLEEAYEVSPPPTTSRRSAAASARRTGCAKAIASSRRASRAVTIGAVERYITDTAFEQRLGQADPARARELAQSVGIIGAGPAGLAAAEQLRRRGYQVTVYDRYDRVGGLLIYGIPNFKLEKHVVLRRWDLLERWRHPVPAELSTSARDVPLRRTARARTTRC